MLATAAAGHDWYPASCCSGQDCAPATVTQVPTGALASALAPGHSLPSAMLVSTIHGSVIVPADFKPRVSPDGQPHACMQRSFTTGQIRLLCLFLPPSS